MVHDATHYPWLRDGQAVAADTVIGLRGPGGDLATWRAETSIEEALAAPLGGNETAIDVYANHGRWIVECPDCHDAQLAVRDDRRYMCPECGNATIAGVWRRVLWPKGVEQIETLLDVRGEANRHWYPGESAANLKAENKRAGVKA